ncbi:YadA family autotransporter adhesin, partial [Paenalcaligenes hominis]|uniref:YadA family autotransporter adhesin n=1 Tax=Paenalcaligenes hominis TaxID=643674 RepID=UPI003524A9DD
HKDLGDTLGIVGGLAAGAAASSANITTVQNANGELEIQLAKNLTDLDTVQVDNSITIGDDLTNQTVINQGSVSTTNLTVTGETKLGDHFSVTNQGDVHYDGPITDATHIVNKEYVDQAGDELTTKGMNFVGSDGQVIHKDLGDTLGIVGGLAAGAAASSANITTVQNANGELEIQLAKNLTDLDTVQVDNSITIGDDLTNQTVINQGSVSTTNLTVTGETKLGDHFTVTSQGDVHYDGPITDATHIVNKEYVDQASDELTTKGMNFVGSDGQVIHKDLGDTLGIVGGLAAGAAASSANITTVQNANGELEIQLAKNLTDLDTVQVDNSITIGDDLTNQTVINQGSVSTTNLTVTGETKLGDHFTVTNQGDVHYDGPITDATHIVNKEYLTQELGTAIAGSGWYVSTGKGADKAESYVAPQQEVNVVNNDSNLALSQKDIIEQDADGNDVVVGQQLGFDLAHTVQIGAKELDGSVGDNPQVVIGEDGAGQGVPGITVPASGNGQGAVTIGGGDVTIDWIDQAGQKTPIAVGDTLMKGLNFSGNNYAATDADSIVNKKFGERLEILGVDWIETEVKDGAIYIKLADNFPVVPKPGDNAGGSTPGGGNTPGGEGNGGTPAPGDGLGNIVAGGDIQGGNNINVKPGEGDHSLIIETTPDVEHNSVTVGDVVINQDGIHAGNTQITGVANGTKNDHAVNLGQLKDSIHQLDQDLTQKGMNFADSNGDSLHRDLGETLHIVGANDNITTRVDQKGILEIALSDDLNVDSITINNGGPIIDVNGIDMSNTTIKNVAAGVEEGDAVNVGQLHDVRDNLQGQVNVMRRDMHRIDRRLRGGVAAAMATASLPQAYLPGKSMMAISGGTWAGESGVAIGYSGISDNGKWIMKLSGNSSSRGDYGGAVGVGYQW